MNVPLLLAAWTPRTARRATSSPAASTRTYVPIRGARPKGEKVKPAYSVGPAA